MMPDKHGFNHVGILRYALQNSATVAILVTFGQYESTDYGMNKNSSVCDYVLLNINLYHNQRLHLVI